MDAFDAVIIGGGPAGSTCARQLRRAGMTVAVLDKARFPRDKTCAGWITPAVIDTLQLDLEEYAQTRTIQAINAFQVGMFGQPGLEVNYGHVVSYGIRRCEFDQYLLMRCGASLRLGESLQSLRRTDQQWIINEQLTTPIIVGAGGHFCPVARHIGAQLGRAERVVAAQEVEFEMNNDQLVHCHVAGEQPHLYFSPDLQGYAWCFRKGNYLNIGLGHEDNHRLAERVNHFMDHLQQIKLVPRGIPRDFKGHAYLLYDHSSRPLYDDGVLLIGDAAGLACPESGEGIHPAIESAMMAAETIIAAAQNYHRDRLASYHTRITRRFGPRGQSIQPTSSWSQNLKQRAAQHLLASRWFVQHIVLDRWFLHAGSSTHWRTL